ncbi:Tat pathway signal protein [Halosegnis sp.]|uniref:DUF7405 family protein n=1 Tax=Halosegnis sp. TaxID=2864959 RepID=UPI0035D42E35
MTPTRRDVLKAAVATGGAAGLSACLDVTGGSDPPTGSDPAALPERQFAWSDRVRHDEHGNEQLPRHQILLYLTLTGDGPPTAADREQVAAAFDALTRAYEWSHEGVLWSVAYSPAYFDRFEASLPDTVDCPPPRALSPFETPDFDEQDMLVHLASDNADAVLQAEQALRGTREEANGITFEASLAGVASLADEADRRTGFVGAGMPAARQSELEGVPDDGPVPEASPLFMGFTAGFAANQASESYVAIDEAPFADGTTKHVANIRQRLSDWYGEQNHEERVAEMFSPEHAQKEWVEGVGESLGANSRVDETLDDIREQAREYGRVGHAQKAARANRDEEGNVKLLRRHFESTDDDVASLHFPSLQQQMSEFEAVRTAMNGTDITEATPAVRQRVNNGILEYIFVVSRGNWLVPPRSKLALPRPR